MSMIMLRSITPSETLNLTDMCVDRMCFKCVPRDHCTAGNDMAKKIRFIVSSVLSECRYMALITSFSVQYLHVNIMPKRLQNRRQHEGLNESRNRTQ